MTHIIELEHVWKSFRGVGALRDVSFGVSPGEVVCLLGDNGAGKSTLVKIMSGVHLPDRGRVLVSGHPVAQWSPKNSRKAGIETIYQDKALAPRQTVARNIFMGRELANAFGLISDRRQAAEADVLLRRLGFTSKVLDVNSPIAGLSGGEQEGVAIARALLFQGSIADLGRTDDRALAHAVATGARSRVQGPRRRASGSCSSPTISPTPTASAIIFSCSIAEKSSRASEAARSLMPISSATWNSAASRRQIGAIGRRRPGRRGTISMTSIQQDGPPLEAWAGWRIAALGRGGGIRRYMRNHRAFISSLAFFILMIAAFAAISPSIWSKLDRLHRRRDLAADSLDHFRRLGVRRFRRGDRSFLRRRRDLRRPGVLLRRARRTRSVPRRPAGRAGGDRESDS